MEGHAEGNVKLALFHVHVCSIGIIHLALLLVKSFNSLLYTSYFRLKLATDSFQLVIKATTRAESFACATACYLVALYHKL